MNDRRLDRAVRLSVCEGALATSMGTLLSGAFLTGFALLLGANALQVGILAALPSLASLAQLWGSYLLERGTPRKRFCLTMTAVSRLLFVPLLAAPLLNLPRDTTIWLIVGCLGVSHVVASMAGVAWLSWIYDLIPGRRRVGFFALRNRCDTALSLTLCLAGAAFIDWWLARSPESPLGYGIVFALAIACGLVGTAILRRMPDVRSTPQAGESFGRLLAGPVRDANFRRLLAFYSFWNLSTNLATPFFVVFMFQRLHLTLGQITVLQTLASVAGILANAFWSRAGQRFGAKPVIFAATLLDAFHPLCWVFLTPDASWALPFLFLFSGSLSSPLATGPNNLICSLAPSRSTSPYIAVFNAVNGPVTGLSAIAAGSFASLFVGMEWTVGGATIGALRLLFLLSFAGRLLSLAALAGVAEPGAQGLRSVLASLRGTEESPATLPLPAARTAEPPTPADAAEAA